MCVAHCFKTWAAILVLFQGIALFFCFRPNSYNTFFSCVRCAYVIPKTCELGELQYWAQALEILALQCRYTHPWGELLKSDQMWQMCYPLSTSLLGELLIGPKLCVMATSPNLNNSSFYKKDVLFKKVRCYLSEKKSESFYTPVLNLWCYAVI